MKLSKKIAFGWLLLCLPLLFGGCSSLLGDGESAANNSAAPQNTATVADGERNKINANIGKLRKEISDLTKNREQAVREIAIIQDPSLKGEDFKIGDKSFKAAEKFCQDDKKKNSAQCEAFLNSSSQIGSKEEILQQEQNKYDSLPVAGSPPANTAASNSKPAGGGINFGEDGFWKMIFLALGGIVGLTILGGLVWLAYRTISNSFKQERDDTVHGFRLAEKNAQELSRKISELEKTVKLQSSQFTQIQTAIQSIERRISENGGQKYQSQPVFTLPDLKPEPQFPVAAEDYLNKIGATAQTATAGLIDGQLVNDANKGNEFLIARDNSLADGLLYAVPNAVRFSTKGDYLNYYQKYYHCENPGGGTIWIKSPTSVRQADEGGWMLVEKGELEVR